MRIPLVGLLFSALVLTACSNKPAEVPRAGTLTPVELANHPPITPLPDPELQGGHVGRAPRRITVAQLKASILTVSGRQWSQIDNLAASLGKADYALVNAESVEPNLVFAKFLEDGAREVCTGAAAADLTTPNAADRILSPEVPASITDLSKIDAATAQKNLVYLSTRIWGQPLAGAELETWTSAFTTMAARAQAANKKREAWGAICIAMMTDPRFITY
ncbi:MAG: hypothetical protein H6Q89_1228 [Myxococcaceae bacterium]|nr:hypothetical protein [Myxococcaceae bacterium]